MSAFVPYADRRLALVDVLRGAALLGICLANVATFAFPMDQVLAGATPVHSVLDRILLVGEDAFITGKFFPLFSLLFGFGLAIQLERGEARGDDARWRLVRRHIVVIGLGVLHAYFIWPGEILVFYGFLGLFLLLFAKTRPRRLSLMGVLTLVVPTVSWCALLAALMYLSHKQPEIARILNEVPTSVAPSDLHGLITANESALRDLLLSSAVSSPVSLAMALFGMALARVRWLHDRHDHAAQWRALRRWCVLPAIVGNGAMIAMSPALGWIDSPQGVLALARFTGLAIGGPSLSLIYLATAALQYQEAKLDLLAHAGRMSLSNYLLQSLVFAAGFYGLGFAGHASFSLCIGVALVLWCVQLPLSRWWLTRFRFGPVEWLLRSVTYWRWV